MMGWGDKANDAYMTTKGTCYTLFIKVMGLGAGSAQSEHRHPRWDRDGGSSGSVRFSAGFPGDSEPISQFKHPLSCFHTARFPLTSQMLRSIFNTTVETLSSALKPSSTVEMSNLNDIFIFFTWDKVHFLILKSTSSLLNVVAPLIHFAVILSFQRSVRQAFPLRCWWKQGAVISPNKNH